MEGRTRIAWLLLITTAVLMNVGESQEEEASRVIHVGGKVLCQDCTQGWNDWVHGDKPIKGCRVSVTCIDERKRAVYYGSDETDEVGEFELTISKYVYGKEIKPETCFTRLVSSPDPVCNIPTNFGGGKTGVKLGRPAVVYRDMVKYVLSPFYYTSPMCDEPDTSEDGHSYGEQSKY